MSDAIATNTLSDDEFDFLLREYWEQIALFAYQGYVKNGRGVVCIEREGEKADFLADRVRLMYAVYPDQASDIRDSEMAADYDPQWEIIFQYLRPDGATRTARVRTAPGNRHPWRIYCFEVLLNLEK